MKKNIFGFSLLRVISALAIVIFHTYYLAMSSYGWGTAGYIVSVTLRNAMLFAVPCFVMVSGALLLDPSREITYRRLFSRYILKALLALVIFTFLFTLYDALLSSAATGASAGSSAGPSAADGFSFVSVLTDTFKNLYIDGSWPHMWYLYLLLALYLMLPIYRKAAAGMSPNDFRYLLLLLLVFQFLWPLLGKLTGSSTAFYICTSTVYPFYLFLGYALFKHYLPCTKTLGLCLLLVGTIITCLLTVLGAARGITFGASSASVGTTLLSLVNSYSFPSVILQGAGMFMLIMAPYAVAPDTDNETPDSSEAPENGTGFKRLIHSIDSCSFGIYLLHLVPLKFLFYSTSFAPEVLALPVGLLLLLLIALVDFFLSYLITLMLRKIPGVKRVL